MCKIRLSLIISTLAANSALAGIENSGFQYSAYLGGTLSSVRPAPLQMLGEIDSLKPAQTNQNDFSWGLGFAYRHLLSIPSLHDVSLGLDFFHLQLNQKGEVWQYQIPTMYNFNYQLPINSSRLLLDMEVNFQPWAKGLYPFVEAGIGAARNSAYYFDTPVPGFDGQGIQTESNSQYQFAYTVGAGLKWFVSDNVNLSFRYLYANLGHVNTSQIANIDLLAPVHARLSTQAWLFGLSYLC